ncbi:NUDIX domain-containing protein [Nonomuraea sp. NPDC049309]|uniref:NUDIX domain-containing protein n=1 Tax=Nonomuraea sp. NPDC049309 TaxID=3364350 RepID=UPI0037125636
MTAKDGDGWTECARGHRHWGVHGASGLLVVHHDDRGVPYVLLQKRSLRCHHGGTWALPGRARDSHEDAVTTALREAREEASLGFDPETLVLDVANIVGARAERGWWNDRLGAATRLLRAVSGLRLSHPVLAQWYPRVVAVVEGAARSAPEVPGIQVVAAMGSGDDAIVGVVRRARPWERVLVVTADRGLRGRVEELGAQTVGPKWLLSQLP